MDKETVVVQVLAEGVTPNGHTSSDEGATPVDGSSNCGDPGKENTKLLRKPLSPITKSYKEKKHHCKQCGAQFLKKLDMHIHRLTHSETDERGNLIEQTGARSETGLDLTLPKEEDESQSEPNFVNTEHMENNSDRQDVNPLDRPKDHTNNQMISHDDVMVDRSYVGEGYDEQLPIDDDVKDFSSSNEGQDMLSKILSDASQSKYHLDIIVPTPRRTYQCGPCNQRFTDYSLYLHHREDHPPPKLFKCSVCSKGFTIKGNLTRHLQIHKDVRLFECNFCLKKFSQKTHLVAHLGTHTRKPFFCKFCGLIFQKEQDLRAHEFQEHAHDEPLSDLCQSSTMESSSMKVAGLSPEEICALQKYKSSVSLDSLEEFSNIDKAVDVLSAHSDDTCPETYYRNIHYTCGTCGIVFFDFQTYITHKKEHPTPKLFACEQCGKSFTVKGNLQRHLQIHQDIRLHECEICHKKFSQKTHLAAHMHVHSKERPYLCTLCGGSFTREGNLRRHIKMHTNIKKVDPVPQTEQHLPIFKCEECFKTFMRKGNLKRHERLHTR